MVDVMPRFLVLQSCTASPAVRCARTSSVAHGGTEAKDFQKSRTARLGRSGERAREEGARGENWGSGWLLPSPLPLGFACALRHCQKNVRSSGTPGEGWGEGDFERRTASEIHNHPHP